MATRDLLRLLQVNFSFPATRPTIRLIDFPEIQLASLLVIAVKLYHPWDSLGRSIHDHAESGALAINWPTWVQSQESLRDHSKPMISATESDVFDMSSANIDEYLKWYAKTWVTDGPISEKKGGLPEQLLDMFPITSTQVHSQAHINRPPLPSYEQNDVQDHWKEIQRSLSIRPVQSANEADDEESDSPCLGALYQKFPNLKLLPSLALVFHQTVADIVGISVSSLLFAVSQMEMRIERWRKDQGDLDTTSSESDDNHSSHG